jgi:hypothetical protein
MKILKISLLTGLALLFINISSYSQSSTTMQDILETTTQKVKELEEQRNQEIVNMTFDLIVNKGKKTIWRYLDPAFDYDALILGDRRVGKIRITVSRKDNTSGEWVFVDEYADDRPLIRLDPQEFEQYEFTISVDEFRTGSTTGHFAFLLYHQNPERGQ